MDRIHHHSEPSGRKAGLLSYSSCSCLRSSHFRCSVQRGTCRTALNQRQPREPRPRARGHIISRSITYILYQANSLNLPRTLFTPCHPWHSHRLIVLRSLPLFRVKQQQQGLNTRVFLARSISHTFLQSQEFNNDLEILPASANLTLVTRSTTLYKPAKGLFLQNGRLTQENHQGD
jgi:hypothetical protein